MSFIYPYRNLLIKIFISFIILVAFYFLYKAATQPLAFDDAYMFTRYAKNMLINHNFGWNAGERTYGCTSIAYTLFVTLAEIVFPKSLAGDEFILKFSSFFWGIMALLIIYKSLKMIVNNTMLKKVYLPQLIILIVLFMPVFTYNLFNGMDTTMSLFGNSLMIFLFLRYDKKRSIRLLVFAALSAYFIFFVRPDNGLCMMIFPAIFLWNTERKPKVFIITYTVIFFCLIADALCKYLYFGYVVPLPFYVKSFGLYDSYLGISKWTATQYLHDIFIPFFSLVILYILFIKRSTFKKTFIYWLPLLLTYAYFFTIVQVMGTASRYYLPFIPFFVIGLAIGINDSMQSDADFKNLKIAGLNKRILILLLLIPAVSIFGYFSDVYYGKLNAAVEKEAQKYTANDSTGNSMLADADWWQSILSLDSLMKRLPVNTIVAASEDGFLGSDNMQMQVMDLSQLHNNDVLQKIPLVNSIERVKPDIIWLPHTDYPKMRYDIFHSPQLLSEYNFFPGILSYGIAIKKTYPNYNEVVDYFQHNSTVKTNLQKQYSN